MKARIEWNYSTLNVITVTIGIEFKCTRKLIKFMCIYLYWIFYTKTKINLTNWVKEYIHFSKMYVHIFKTNSDIACNLAGSLPRKFCGNPASVFCWNLWFGSFQDYSKVIRDPANLLRTKTEYCCKTTCCLGILNFF